MHALVDVVDNTLLVCSHLRSVLGYLADARGGVLADVQVRVPEALEDVGEDLGLHHHLSQVHGVLRDLPQAAAYLAFGVSKRRPWRGEIKKVGFVCGGGKRSGR